jgi:hypothetical protein
MSFVCGCDDRTNEWIVRSVEGSGWKGVIKWGLFHIPDKDAIKYRLLSEFKDYKTVNWLRKLDQEEIDQYIDTHPCKGYDIIGYFQCSANRLSRGLIPAVENKGLYCWEDVCELCEAFNKPFMTLGEMAYMPEFVKETT